MKKDPAVTTPTGVFLCLYMSVCLSVCQKLCLPCSISVLPFIFLKHHTCRLKVANWYEEKILATQIQPVSTEKLHLVGYLDDVIERNKTINTELQIGWYGRLNQKNVILSSYTHPYAILPKSDCLPSISLLRLRNITNMNEPSINLLVALGWLIKRTSSFID